ncbi:hypothetical protein HYALB_00012756 [Hymenoscyphus albidus]|uniref:GST N-terminal domain-containing protein n=1 Tax=Hymenoscyphus albidus TaxID=595503 RepID=A0A9N9Q545_9HELO|nr:hypothetical protein HYALB_00012756 [Hymenoscyphus albidus]
MPPKLPRSFDTPLAPFTGVISTDLASEFPAAKGRYALYIHLGCPWAHRTHIVYRLKQLESIIALSVVSIHRNGENGWKYDGTGGSDETDPVEGFRNFRELYEKADPGFAGSSSVPLIWDREKKTIVSNDSVGIIRMLFDAFDAFLPEEIREVNKPGGGLRPESLKEEIDELSNSIEMSYNWGTYKIGMVASQKDYDGCMKALFGLLGELDERLAKSKFLHGDHITETDIRFFPTTVRFDIAYYTIFRCNWKQIRYDYPNIHRWLRKLYYEVDEEFKGAFKSTTHFDIFMEGYALSAMGMDLVPWGPAVPIMTLDA